MNSYTEKPSKVIRIEKAAIKKHIRALITEVERIASNQDRTAARALEGIESELIAVLRTAKTY